MLTSGSKDHPTLVLLHGWGASKEIWQPTLRSTLSKHLHLVALDMPGVGDNAHLETDGTPRAMAEAIHAMLQDHGLTRFSVLGHSQGANVACNIAKSHPDEVQSLILVDPALYSDKIPGASHYLHPGYGAPLLGTLRHMAGVAAWIDNRLPAKETEDLHPARGYMRRGGYLKSNNQLNQLLSQIRGLTTCPFEIADLDTSLPILIIHGENDLTIPVTHARAALQSRPANTKLVVYDDAMHCPMDTHFARFVGDVGGFLKAR